MKNYIAERAGFRNFILKENDITTGTLTFRSAFSTKADIEITGQARYQLEPKNFWQQQIIISADTIPYLNIRMSWLGKMMVTTASDGQNLQYIFRRKGWFKSGFILVSEAGETVIETIPKFIWKRFRVEYHITALFTKERAPYDMLLLFASVYMTQRMQQMQAAAAH